MTAKNSFAQAAASKHAQIDLALSKDASKCCKPISDFKVIDWCLYILHSPHSLT